MAVILLPTAVETSEPPLDRPRLALVTWILVALIVIHFLVTQLVALDHARRWGLIDEHTFRAVTYATTVWSLYPEPGLFAPWQLWTYVFVHDGWIELALVVTMLALAGRTVERWLGSAAYLGALVTLAPLVAVLHLLVGHDDEVLTGADGLAMGVLGLAWALFPAARVRWGLAYFAVIVLGYQPLFRMAMPWLALLWLAALVAVHHDQPVPAIVSAGGALAAGVVLGLAGRRIRGADAS